MAVGNPDHVAAHRHRASPALAKLLSHAVWSPEVLADAGVQTETAMLVTVGGGIGSFTLVDAMRIAGTPREAIRVLARNPQPWATYAEVTGASQMPPAERIRSDSMSSPDNLWGFPGYALREAVERRTLAPVARVLTEPELSEYYTPQVARLCRAIDRETDRIGYADMVRAGEALAVRRARDGGYWTMFLPREPAAAPIAWRSRYVHLGVGYPALRHPPDTAAYRDDARVAHAYEPHEHIYEDLRQARGTVVVRGRGIAASRILQRLLDDRDRHGAETRIVHLVRGYVAGAHGPSPFLRRRGGQGWAYQAFNWPKAAWGGQYKARLARASDDERAALYGALEGTTTARRRRWRRQLASATRSGVYRMLEGCVTELASGADGTLTVTVDTRTVRSRYTRTT